MFDQTTEEQAAESQAMMEAEAPAETLEAPAETSTDVPPDAPVEAPKATPVASDDAQKYNSSGKRGPTQGVGEYAKSLLKTGMSSKDVLTKVLERFPTAKTSMGCIAYYKNALNKKDEGVTVEALRAKALSLREEAEKLDQQALELEVAQDEAAAKAEAEANKSAEPADVPPTE